MSTQETNEPLKLSRESIQRITEKMVDVVIKEIEDQQAADMEKAVENAKPKWKWWRPNSGSQYWYMGDGFIQGSIWNEYNVDHQRYYNFNVFRSKSEAKEFQHLGTYQRKWAMILKELNPEEWKPDWHYGNERWSPAINNRGQPEAFHNVVKIMSDLCYAESIPICKRAIEFMGNDIYRMLGVPIPGDES